MRQLSFLLLIIISISAVSQSTKATMPLAIEDPEMDAYLRSRATPELTIKVINNPAPEKRIDITYTLVSFGANFQTKNNAQLNNNGELKILLEQNLPYQQLFLNIGDYLYTTVYVNTDLTVTINAGKTGATAYRIGDGAEFSGTDGELNKVMTEKGLFRQKESSGLTSLLERIVRENFGNASKELAAKFQLRADSIQEKLTEIDDVFVAKYPQYEWAIRNETESGFYTQLCFGYNFCLFPDSVAKKVYAHKPYFTSNDGVYFYKSLNNYVTYNFGDHKQFPYEEIIINYAEYKPEQKAILDSIGQYEKIDEAAKKLNEQVMNTIYQKGYTLFYKELKLVAISSGIKAIDKSVDGPKADILKLPLLEKGKDMVGLAYNEILKNTKTEWCKRLIENELTATIAKQKGMDALLDSSRKLEASNILIGTPLKRLYFGAELYKLDSVKNVEDFIIALKSKYKNKALIIDFWATWCGPCIMDMPYSKKLHEETKDLPIEYIYLCTNSSSNEELWKKRIIDAKLPGTHIFIDDKIITDLKNKFDAVSGFPAYVVIDIKGVSHPKAIQFMIKMDKDKMRQVAGL